MDDFQVLDKGYVRFIEKMGTEETIIEAARMSTGRGFERWDPGEVCKNCRVPRDQLHSSQWGNGCPGHMWIAVPGDARLLEYLYKNGHTTPFEMCQLHVEINAPIMVWRQLHRH